MSTTTSPGLAGLAERAVRAARVHRAADPDGFGRRHDTPDEWNRWARRARVARTVAAALQVPVNAVLVTDDPHRTYRTRTGEVPGDLITVTDPLAARAWRFIPDFTTPGDGWLLLDRCPDCEAEIPVAGIVTLADLGEYLDPDGDIWAADVLAASGAGTGRRAQRRRGGRFRRLVGCLIGRHCLWILQFVVWRWLADIYGRVVAAELSTSACLDRAK